MTYYLRVFTLASQDYTVQDIVGHDAAKKMAERIGRRGLWIEIEGSPMFISPYSVSHIEVYEQRGA